MSICSQYIVKIRKEVELIYKLFPKIKTFVDDRVTMMDERKHEENKWICTCNTRVTRIWTLRKQWDKYLKQHTLEAHSVDAPQKSLHCRHLGLDKDLKQFGTLCMYMYI